MSKSTKSSETKFSDPFKNLPTTSALRATESQSVRAGQYRRKTITLPPAQIEYISQAAGKMGIGILAFYRWLIDQGLLVYDSGIEPELTPKPEHDLEVKHHTS